MFWIYLRKYNCNAPNPSTDGFILTAQEPVSSFTIINNLGNILFQGGNLQAGESLYVDANLKNGLYMLLIQYSDGKIEVKKIQKLF